MKKIITSCFYFCLVSFNYLSAQLDPNLETMFQNSLVQHYALGFDGISAAVRTSDGFLASAAGISALYEHLTTASTFGMGSVTKTIISATFLHMAEDGLLDLDNPLGDYLPDIEFVDPAITIRQLLNHTSGIYDIAQNPNFWDDVFANQQAIISPWELLENYLSTPNFPAGMEWAYSNTNYIVLGLIIEAISDTSYYAEARARFDFDVNYPSFSVPPYESATEDMAHLWMDTTFSNGPLVDIHASGWSLDALFSAAGAAEAYASNPSDLATWAYDLFSGALLESGSMDALLEIVPPSTRWGLGVEFEQTSCGQERVGHVGSIYYTTATFYDPENDIAVSVHCNSQSNYISLVTSLASTLICNYEEFLMSTSTEDAPRTHNFRVYPNPASNFLNISWSGNQNKQAPDEIVISDLYGRIVFMQQLANENLSNQVMINLNELQSGSYVLIFRNDGQLITFNRFIVMK